MVINPPRGFNHRVSDDWLEKNLEKFFELTPAGTAEGCGKDFHQKILD
jgi:hypothetical protein